MIENDCSRQSENQRGESLSSSLLKQSFNVSAVEVKRVSSAEPFLNSAKRKK